MDSLVLRLHVHDELVHMLKLIDVMVATATETEGVVRLRTTIVYSYNKNKL
jgi:hypothetical protein